MKRILNKVLILFTAVFASFLISCAPAKLTSYTMKLGYFPEDSDGLEAVAYACTLEKDMYVFKETLSLGTVSSGAFIEAEIGTLEAHPYVLVILQSSSGTRYYSSDVWDLSKVKGNELRCEYWNCLSGGSPNGTYAINGVMINSLSKETMNRTLTFDFSLQPYYIFKVSKEVSSEFLYEIYTSSEYVFALGSDNFNDIIKYNKSNQLKYINVNPSFGYESVTSNYVYYDTSKNLIKGFSDYYILVFATQITEDTAFSICLTDTEWLNEVSENYEISEYSSAAWDSIKSTGVDGRIYFASKNKDKVLRSYNPKEKEMKIEKVFEDNIMSVVSYGKEVFVSTSTRDDVLFSSNYKNRIYSYNTISGETSLLYDDEKLIDSIELSVSDCNLVFFEKREKKYSTAELYLRSFNLPSSEFSEIKVFEQNSGYRSPVILFIENGKVYYAALNKTVGSVEINPDGTFGSGLKNLVENIDLKLHTAFVKNGHNIILGTYDGTKLLKETDGTYNVTETDFDVASYKTITEFDGKIFAVSNKNYTIKDKYNKEYEIRVNGSDKEKNSVQLMSFGVFDAATYQKDSETMRKWYYSDTIGMTYNKDTGYLEGLIRGIGFAVQGDTLYLVAMDVPAVKDGKNLISFIPVWSKASDWDATLGAVTANVLGFNGNTNMKFDSSYMKIEE